MSRYSNSYIETFTRCPLAAFYQNELRLSRIGDDSGAHHLVFGAAGHEAIRALYETGDIVLAQEMLRAAYPVQLDVADLAKTADNGCFTIEKYWEEYDKDRDWEVLSVEEKDLTEDDFTVKLDLVVRDIRNGDILGVDHKFTGRYLNYDFFGQFNPNSQVTHYVRYIKEKYGRCDGFVINAISLRYRQRASKDGPAGFWCAFERQVYNRNDGQIERTVRSKDEAINDIERCKLSNYWRPAETPNACKFCAYRELCGAGWSWDEDSELILNSFRQTCPKYAGTEHCNLDLDHDGECSTVVQQVVPVEFEVDV